MRIELGTKRPRVAEDAWIAPGVILIGDVAIGAEANLWFGVIARGDREPITIGPRANVQDGVILHTDPGLPLRIGADVAIGHGAIVHGAIVEDDVLIGMGATVLSGARIGTGSLIGARSLVLEHQEIPPRSLVVGSPARIVREVEPGAGRETCLGYLDQAARYRAAPTKGET